MPTSATVEEKADLDRITAYLAAITQPLHRRTGLHSADLLNLSQCGPHTSNSDIVGLLSRAQKAKAIAKGETCDLRERARNESGGPAREGGENLTEGTGRGPKDGTERNHGVGWRIDDNSMAAENLRENGGSRGNLDSRQLYWHRSSSNVRNPFGANAGRSYCTAEIRYPTNHVRLPLSRSLYY